jgi:hypothetical protein
LAQQGPHPSCYVVTPLLEEIEEASLNFESIDILKDRLWEEVKLKIPEISEMEKKLKKS